jgi:2,3-bisphosphoglycerate-independent phosphoglycerate mutase
MNKGKLTPRRRLWQTTATMNRQKTIIFLPDGMADEPVAELDNRTPLQYADTPAMDSIAEKGRSGTLLTLPEGFPTSSEVANMSVLGCDLAGEYCGRGPLEAAGRNVELTPDDLAFRLNLVTVEDGILKDYSGGHVAQEHADELIKELNQAFGNEYVRFHPGLSYRTLLILTGKDFSAMVKTDKPDDSHGEKLSDHYPAPLEPAAESTAELLTDLMINAGEKLRNSPVNRKLEKMGKPPVNAIWPWSGGRGASFVTLKEKFGITGAVISAVDVINGLGRFLGMDVINVPGATGYIDTDYEGKASAAVEALQTHDFAYLHLEAIDEVSHQQNVELKVKTIEEFDSRVVAAALDAIGDEVAAAVLPDHPVPVKRGKHTRTPVPVAVRMAGAAPDGVRQYDEYSCRKGSLGAMTNGDLMKLLYPDQ